MGNESSHKLSDIPSNDSSKMEIYIKTITWKTYTVDYEQYDSIENLKAKIQDKTSIPTDQIILVFNRKILKEGTLRDYNIENKCTIDLVLKLSAAPKIEE